MTFKNFEGKPCKGCREIITVYSASGYCRECFHKRRGGINFPGSKNGKEKPINHCPRCGRYQVELDLCPDCRNNTPGYLEKYRIRNINGVIKPEHRAIWEEIHGPLPDGWVVHHLNGLKGDNRLENLKAMPRSDRDSKSIISALKQRIRELEACNESR